MEITGRIFHIHPINDKICQVVIKKRIRGKVTPIAFTVFGYWKDLVLKLKKNDKINAFMGFKTDLYKGKYYTEISLFKISKIEDKPKEPKAGDGSDTIIPLIHIYDDNGNIIL